MKQILSNLGGRLLLAIISILPAPLSAAEADVVTSSNTFGHEGEADAVENWVVATPDELSQGMINDFVAGTGSPGFHSGADVVFIYQIANNAGGNETFDGLIQEIPREQYLTSWG